MSVSRRVFLTAGSAAAAVGLVSRSTASEQAAPTAPAVHDLFPTQPPELVREMVGVSHGAVARVRELVLKRPALAKAVWDWGYGDWESALGAASHVGHREIAELLIANGARPDLFSAAMLGQLDVVKAFIAQSPGSERIRGPHGIPLLAHAEAGGERALPVVAYLRTIEGTGERAVDNPMTEAEIAALTGRYRFGPGPRDVFVVEPPKGKLVQLGIARVDGTARNLFHIGGRRFHPAGAEAVRLQFSPETPAATLTLSDPDPVVAARRET